MVPVRILTMAALLSVAAASAQAGESRRLWTDPPPGAGPAAGPPEAAPGETSPAGTSAAGTLAVATWPDETQRRRLPDLSGSAPAETFASAKAPIVTATAAPAEPADTEPEPEETIEPRRDGAPKTQAAPMSPLPRPAVSDRTRRRLGVLAGFAGAASAPDDHTASVRARRR